MRLTTFTILLAPLLAPGASAHAAEVVVAQFSVDAGQVRRRNAPVVAEIKGKPLAATLAAAWHVVSGNDAEPAIPAQVERLGEGAVLVRWIEPDLQPGKPKRYELVPSAEKTTEGMRFVEGDGFRDLTAGTSGIYRHMNRYDAADHVSTFKPFHHVFGMHGEGFITNGPGREDWGTRGEKIRYPHHRGLFFGYNKTPFGDFWHGKAGESQRHRAYKKERELGGPLLFAAREASVNEWTAKDGKPVIRDTRELTTWRVSERHLVLDFDVTLESLTGEAILLSGDAQHAGFHFRAANEVGQTITATAATAATAATKPATRGTTGGNAFYTRPATAVAKGNDVWADCPWVYCAFTIKGHPYGVTEMNAPTNPQPTVFSTRPYGRFGAFVKDQSVAPDKPLKLTYRFIIRDATRAPPAEQLEAEYLDWITPVKVTVAK